MTEGQLREAIELRKQTESRLWEKLKVAQNQRRKMETQLKEKEEARLKEERANFPITKVPEKASGKEDQKRKSRERLFEEAMNQVRKLKEQRGTV